MAEGVHRPRVTAVEGAPRAKQLTQGPKQQGTQVLGPSLRHASLKPITPPYACLRFSCHPRCSLWCRLGLETLLDTETLG